MTIRYHSTRATDQKTLAFDEVILAGLAPDGGLYLPQELPQFSPEEMLEFATMDYPTLAYFIMRPFTLGVLPDDVLQKLISTAYSSFRHPATAPLTQLAPRHFLLELHHGPTLAFKDFALQFLGQLLNYLLSERGETATVVGATSGDTGSAAIAGCSGQDNLSIFILHPHGRVSDVQRRQMTTVADANVHNLAIDGTFDDCQDMVKAMFADAEFRAQQKLVAVNSINWARVLAQVVYYFYAALALGAPMRAVSFSVPTGNFGDIFAGYLAKKMGLPINRLMIASNRNDILTRCLKEGEYAMQGVHPSLSPSMDIQVSSNFERLLSDLYSRNGTTVKSLMNDFRASGSISLSPIVLRKLRAEFSAHSIDDEQTINIIRDVHRHSGHLLDPHSAVGFGTALALEGETKGEPIITLATAHAAKFPDAVIKATGQSPELPAHLSDLMKREERCTRLPNDLSTVQHHIREHA